MLHKTLRLVTLLLVLSFATASASELTLKTDVDWEGGFPTLWFGTAPANGDFGVLGLRLDGQTIEPEITGVVTFFSGPLLSLDIEGNDEYDAAYATYRYAPGSFVMQVSWADEHGALRHGHYVAPLLELQVKTCEKCGPVGEDSVGRFTATLGAGRFDSTLSSVLDLERRASAGTFEGYLDFINGSPDSTTRFAGAPGPWDVSVEVTLPEPAMGALIAAGGLVTWIARRRTSRPGRP